MKKFFKLCKTEDEFNNIDMEYDISYPYVCSVKNSQNVKYFGENYDDDYLTFTILESGTITFKSTNDQVNKTISYSIDNGNTWIEFTSSTTEQSLTSDNLNANDKIIIKGNNNSYASKIDNTVYYNTFGGTAKVKVSGNIMSLLYGDNFKNKIELVESYSFYSLFYQYTNLISSKYLILPATTLKSYCYYNMFRGCANMIDVPNLPAIELTSNCYYAMFRGCTSIVKTQKLPAKYLSAGCYAAMFMDCTSLVSTYDLPGEIIYEGSYANMFRNCSSLKIAPKMEATQLDKTSSYYACQYMFSGCTSLTTAYVPKITNLLAYTEETNWTGAYAYYGMFQKCTSLKTLPTLYATTLGFACYCLMFDGCTGLTDIPADYLPSNLNKVYQARCYDCMFRGCTNITRAPDLLATVLPEKAYYCMFSGCTKLNYIKMMAIDISEANCLGSWVSNVSSTGTFVKNAAATWDVTGNDGVPTGWTVETASA